MTSRGNDHLALKMYAPGPDKEAGAVWFKSTFSSCGVTTGIVGTPPACMGLTLGGPGYEGGGPEGDVVTLIPAKPPSIALISLVFGVDAKETYTRRNSHVNYDIHTRWACTCRWGTGGPDGNVFKLFPAKPPSIAFKSLVSGVDVKENYAKRKCHVNYDIQTEDKQGMFFNALIQLHPDPGPPTRFLFLTPIAKYPDENFPHLEVSI